MDHDIINRKLDSLRRCIERIESKGSVSLSQLESDFDLQDIITVNLERAIQNSVDIAATISSDLKGPTPETMAECFEVIYQAGVITQNLSVRLKKATGFRNLLVHEYAKIDWKIVLKICTHHLGEFRMLMKEIDQWMQKTQKK